MNDSDRCPDGEVVDSPSANMACKLYGMNAELLPAPAAAAAAGLPVSCATVRRWLRAGRIPGAVLVGSRWHVTPDAIRAALVRTPEVKQ